MSQTDSPGAGRVALITGAASGIGRAAALRLLEVGCGVAALDRNAGGLESLARSSPDSGRTLALPADLLDEEETGAALDQALGWRERIDVVGSAP